MKGSICWVYRFCQKHNIRQMKFQGKRVRVDKDFVDAFKARLPSFVEGYEEKDSYNVDESGIFHIAASDKTLAPKDSDCAGVNESKREWKCHFVVKWLEILRNFLLLVNLHDQGHASTLGISKVCLLYGIARKKTWYQIT